MRAGLRTFAVVCGMVVLLLVAEGAYAQDPAKFEVEGRFWVTRSLRASALVEGLGQGTRIDLVRDVGLDEGNIPEIAGAWRTGPRSKLRLAYARIDLDGRATAQRTLGFGGLIFGPGDRVRTTLEQDYLSFEFVWQPLEMGIVKLGPVAGIHGWWASLEMSGPGGSRDESLNNAIPVLGLALDVEPSSAFSLYLQGSGMYQNQAGWHVDGEAGVKIFPEGTFGFTVAYRRFDVTIEDSESQDFAHWILEGPFVGFTYRF